MEKTPLQNDWYEKILEKPLAYRRRLAFFLTGIIGFLIVSVWLFITAYQIRHSLEEETSPTNLLPESSPTVEQAEELPADLQEKNEIFNLTPNSSN